MQMRTVTNSYLLDHGLWSDQMKITFCGHSYFWKTIWKACKSRITSQLWSRSDGSIKFCGCFAATRSEALYKINGVMKKNILKEHSEPSARKLKLWPKYIFQMYNDTRPQYQFPRKFVLSWEGMFLKGTLQK